MAGFYIHSAIHHARPEVEAAAHCHSLHGKAWSTFGKPVDITTQDSCLFYDNLAVYHNFGGIVSVAGCAVGMFRLTCRCSLQRKEQT